jgi:hypothetical protein
LPEGALLIRRDESPVVPDFAYPAYLHRFLFVPAGIAREMTTVAPIRQIQRG